eukprot:scaffold873_cov79-Skeletonema_dohrnii-CCMP3373.AAC.2
MSWEFMSSFENFVFCISSGSFSINSYVKMSSEASSEISSQATQISETTPTQQATQLADDVT